MKKSSVLVLAIAIAMSSCTNQKSDKKNMKTDLAENPLLQPSNLPYGAPDFSKIQDKDYRPAILEGVRIQKANIDSIINETAAATFDNTILALENSGLTLNRVLSVFYGMTGANTDDTLQKVQEDMAPVLSKLNDEIYLNAKLFQRVKALYNKKESLKLDKESDKLLTVYYKNFVMAGATLSQSDKDKLKDINAQLATLTTKFGSVLVDAAKAEAFIEKDSSKLNGLSAAYLASIKTDSGYRIPLNNTTQQVVLSSLTNRAERKAIFENAYHRTDHGKYDARPIITKIANLRAKKAALLGYDNYADWHLQNTMAKNAANVNDFFKQLISPAVAKAKKEATARTEMMHKEGVKGELEPWDWNYYGEQVRKAKYDLNEDQIKQYFVLDSVLKNGVFFAATKLYGITFKKRTDIPTWNDDVVVYELFDKDGSKLGLFYGDYYKRDNKQGGAWMDNFVQQSSLLGTKPVIYNVCNFSKPENGNPALISFDDVTTMFHEFGHALHGFFANQKYVTLSGTNVARDFVEFPSQFNENWATYPTVLHNYAKNYKSGEVIPDELVKKIKASSTFNQGFALTELVAAASLDMAWHTIPSNSSINNADTFELIALHDYGVDAVQAIKPRYRSTYFLHIFDNGYQAGYYSYLWTEMLDHDAYKWFEQHGGLTLANGQRFRDMVLSKGNTENLEEMYEAWRGQKPSIDPMLEARGLE